MKVGGGGGVAEVIRGRSGADEPMLNCSVQQARMRSGRPGLFLPGHFGICFRRAAAAGGFRSVELLATGWRRGCGTGLPEPGCQPA